MDLRQKNAKVNGHTLGMFSHTQILSHELKNYIQITQYIIYIKNIYNTANVDSIERFRKSAPRFNPLAVGSRVSDGGF